MSGWMDTSGSDVRPDRQAKAAHFNHFTTPGPGLSSAPRASQGLRQGCFALLLRGVFHGFRVSPAFSYS